MFGMGFRRFSIGCMIDGHAGIIDRIMANAIGVCLRGPAEGVDGSRRLPPGFDLENRDHFPSILPIDQVGVVIAPPGRGIAGKAASGKIRVGARAGNDIKNVDFQDVAGLGFLDIDRARQYMNAKPLSCPPAEHGGIERPGAAPLDVLPVSRPMKHAFGTGIALDHALPIVGRMLRQRFDDDFRAGRNPQDGRQLVA